MSASRVRVDYAEVLKERARRYHDATAAPEHKALDNIQVRNKKNIDRWRAEYCKLLNARKEDTQ
jgi:hypothetical protein